MIEFQYARATDVADAVRQIAGNHFITITSGLENLAPLGKATLWKGAQDILIEQA